MEMKIKRISYIVLSTLICCTPVSRLNTKDKDSVKNGNQTHTNIYKINQEYLQFEGEPINNLKDTVFKDYVDNLHSFKKFLCK